MFSQPHPLRLIACISKERFKWSQKVDRATFSTEWKSALKHSEYFLVSRELRNQYTLSIITSHILFVLEPRSQITQGDWLTIHESEAPGPNDVIIEFGQT